MMEHYISWIADLIGKELAERIKNQLPKLEKMGIDTPQKFRDKFNKGGIDIPTTEKILKSLKKIERK